MDIALEKENMIKFNRKAVLKDYIRVTVSFASEM